MGVDDSSADGRQLGKQKLVNLASQFKFALTILHKQKGVGEAQEQRLPALTLACVVFILVSV